MRKHAIAIFELIGFAALVAGCAAERWTLGLIVGGAVLLIFTAFVRMRVRR